MDNKERFYDAVRNEMTMILATTDALGVSMREVAPVPYIGDILIFTSADSRKYRALADEPRCCVSIGGIFAECTAKLCGETMDDKNEALRSAYSEKFQGAFDEGIAFGGRECEFILLHPTKLTGWIFDESAPNVDFPTIPFEIEL